MERLGRFVDVLQTGEQSKIWLQRTSEAVSGTGMITELSPHLRLTLALSSRNAIQPEFLSGCHR